MENPKKKKGARKLWGKVSSFVIKKMKRGSGTAEVLSNRSINPGKKDTEIGRAEKRKSIFEAKTKLSPSLFSGDSASVEDTPQLCTKNPKGKVVVDKEGEQSTAKRGQFQLNLQVNTQPSMGDAKRHARSTSPSSYLLHSTLADRIQELAQEYQIQSPNRTLTTQDAADIRKSLDQIALDKLKTQKEILLSWESSTHSSLLKNADVQNTHAAAADPIDSLLAKLGKMETKLGEIESRLIPQSKALKRAITPLEPIADELNLLLTHYQNKELLSERLKYIIDKMEMNVEETSALNHVMNHIPSKRVFSEIAGESGEALSKDGDADEDAIGIVASALKKLDGIGKDLHEFKDMVAVQEAENVIRKKLEALHIHIAHNLFTESELRTLDNHAKHPRPGNNNDVTEMEREYSKIQSKRPNLVFLYKMLHQSIRDGGVQR